MGVKELNNALGLGEGGIDEFLDNLTVDNSSFENRFGDIDQKVKENVDSIDRQIGEYNKNGIGNINVSDINQSLKKIEELIEVSKNTIKHVYESIVTSELVDSELVQAFSKLIESTHLTISEYISMYKDRLSFYDKVRLEMLKHQQKIDLMNRKHKLDLETIQEKNRGSSIDAPNLVEYSQEDITMDMNEREQKEQEEQA